MRLHRVTDGIVALSGVVNGCPLFRLTTEKDFYLFGHVFTVLLFIVTDK